MGKTALIRHLEARFFADPELPSLAAAVRRYGFLPVVAAARGTVRRSPAPLVLRGYEQAQRPARPAEGQHLLVALDLV
jgi:hypothetical protein